MSLIDRESYLSLPSSEFGSDGFFLARKINIVVADAYPMIVQGLRYIFSSVENMQIVAETNTLSGMASLLTSYQCDVLICDYSFGDDPEPDGMRMLESIRRNHPNVKIVLLAELRDGLSIRRALKNGVSAFVVKSSDDSLFLPKIVEKVMRGKRYVDPDIAGEVLCDFNRDGGRHTRADLLSPRELDVVRLFERGMAVGEIAEKLRRSRKTISTQKANAMRKFGVKTDIDLVDAVRDMLWQHQSTRSF
ncbi:response regulator transcription factor [Burkholderia sp. BE17]|uniref:response regulator transcription factor n=1 Tax=Burkholderia sp. BE17 TaxID=2656644 RepID=UPI00128CA1B7|nr:response regulator transcription factor [Burkholderia sp. BE17]MPV69154.1 response regulator [Burkholderia sp. BE17]